jgi:hypothetical protein
MAGGFSTGTSGSLRPTRPDLVCVKRNRQWLVVVEAPEELVNSVRQDGQSIESAAMSPGWWPVPDLDGEVVIDWDDGEPHMSRFDLTANPYLVFRLRAGEDRGRWTAVPTMGSFLVLVPSDWRRDEERSGPPPARPEATSVPGFQAHFFDLDDHSASIAFRGEGGRLISIDRRARYEFVGERVSDASDRIGPLFAGEPPLIRALDDQLWQEIRTIVIGVEGSRPGRWRQAFSPSTMQQDLRLQVLDDREGGWYFVRLYDACDDLIESFDFRFARRLVRVDVETPPLVPPVGGHGIVDVTIHHHPGCPIRSVNDLPDGVEVTRSDRAVAISLPASPTADATRWLIGPPGDQAVTFVLRLDRLWWARGPLEGAPSEWCDRPVPIVRGDLGPTSADGLWLLLPASGIAKAVLLGFQREHARRVVGRLEERAVALPLRLLGDTPEAHIPGFAPLNLWLEIPDTPTPTAIAELCVRIACLRCEHIGVREENFDEHLSEEHLDELSPELMSYQELRESIRQLPQAVYRCSHCKFYVASGGINNPTSAIDHHLRTHSGKSPAFAVVSDVDEIRNNLLADLPIVRRCALCPQIWSNSTPAERLDHLLRRHRMRLCELR